MEAVGNEIFFRTKNEILFRTKNYRSHLYKTVTSGNSIELYFPLRNYYVPFKSSKLIEGKAAIKSVQLNPLNIVNCEQTYNLCKTAVRMLPEVIQLIKDPSEDLCIIACKMQGLNLQLIPEHLKTDNVKLAAVKSSGDAIKFCYNKTDELLVLAVLQSNYLLYSLSEEEQNIVYDNLNEHQKFLIANTTIPLKGKFQDLRKNIRKIESL